MSIYSKTTKGKRTFYYRFTCGKCCKTTEWIPTTIETEYTIERRFVVERELDKQLAIGLEKKLHNYCDTIRKGAEKGYYFSQPPFTKSEFAYNLSSTCPYCGQRGKLKETVGTVVGLYGGAGLFVGAIASLIVVASSNVYTWANAIIPGIVFVGTTLVGCTVGFFVGKKNAGKGVGHTDVQYRFENKPSTYTAASNPLKPVETKCQHDWLCGKCRICGESEKRYEMYGHDVVCGKCVRCGKIPSSEYEILKSHKPVQCKCTVCGDELHDWELVRASGSREEFLCRVCGKEKVEVYDPKYYGGARDD